MMRFRGFEGKVREALAVPQGIAQALLQADHILAKIK
jgi:hypothetical protein